MRGRLGKYEGPARNQFNHNKNKDCNSVWYFRAGLELTVDDFPSLYRSSAAIVLNMNSLVPTSLYYLQCKQICTYAMCNVYVPFFAFPGTEFNEFELGTSLNDLEPVQILNFLFKAKDLWDPALVSNSSNSIPEMEFKEFEPRFKSAKTRFNLSAGLNLETFDTILSGTNHI